MYPERPYNAPSGSVWEYAYTNGKSVLFVILDGHDGNGLRRVLWLRDRHARGYVVFGSHVNNGATRVT